MLSHFINKIFNYILNYLLLFKFSIFIHKILVIFIILHIFPVLSNKDIIINKIGNRFITLKLDLVSKYTSYKNLINYKFMINYNEFLIFRTHIYKNLKLTSIYLIEYLTLQLSYNTFPYKLIHLLYILL
jgi:hypothetical protein